VRRVRQRRCGRDGCSSMEMSMAVSALVSMGHEPNALLAHLERELSMPNTKSDPFASMPPLELLEQAQVLAGRDEQDPHQVDLLLHHLQVCRVAPS
jgi:hypothetical protein